VDSGRPVRDAAGVNPGRGYFWCGALLATACATAQNYPQSAHGVGIAITGVRATSRCAFIDVELVNRGRRPAYLVLAGDSPFFELVTSAYSDDRGMRHLRISFAERPPLGIVFHPRLPDPILVSRRGRVGLRIKLPLPLNEGFSQSVKYTEHGAPPAENLAHVVRDLVPPFTVRVNVGVVDEAVDVSSHDINVWQAIDEVLHRQYLAESRSVLLSPGVDSPAGGETCHPVVDLMKIHK
jgi:hypothetical protein